MTFAELLSQLNQQQNDRIRDQYFSSVFGAGIGQAAQRDSLLQQLRSNTPSSKVAPDPKSRMAEIDKELDIIRGIVPTPRGYRVDPRKAKALIKERTELEKKR